MPELPEVEYARRQLERHCLGRTFLECQAFSGIVSARSQRNVRVGQANTQFNDLSPAAVSDVGRYGKHVWLVMSKLPHFVFHFGMTGSLVVQNDFERLSYRTIPSSGKLSGGDDASESLSERIWPPKWTRFIFRFQGNDPLEVALVDPRKFATVTLCDQQNPMDMPVLQKLGFDPLISMPTVSEFEQLLGQYEKRVIKSLLLDQSFSAGIGNWLADEILYDAKIHPQRYISSLLKEEHRALHKSIGTVVLLACEVNADSLRYPATWLFHVRWTLARRLHSNQVCTVVDVNGIERVVSSMRIQGRMTVFVPALQLIQKDTPEEGLSQVPAKPEIPQGASSSGDSGVEVTAPIAKARAKKKKITEVPGPKSSDPNATGSEATTRAKRARTKEEKVTKETGSRPTAPRGNASETAFPSKQSEAKPRKGTKATRSKSTIKPPSAEDIDIVFDAIAVNDVIDESSLKHALDRVSSPYAPWDRTNTDLSRKMLASGMRIPNYRMNREEFHTFIREEIYR